MEYPNGFELTIGVELEFLVARVLPKGFEERVRAETSSTDEWYVRLQIRNANTDEMRRLIVDRLRAFNIPTNDYSPKVARPNFSMWTVTGDGSVKPSDEEQASDVLTFSNGSQVQVPPQDQKSIRYSDVEVTSRVLPFNELSLLEITTAVDTIRNEIPSFVNETTGLHVHIGNREFGFSLNTLKNLGTLLSIAAHQINELHSDYRITSEFCRSILFAFKPNDRVPMMMARQIENLHTLEDFLTFFHVARPHRSRDDPQFFYHRECAYNFLGLGEDGRIPTIEFRQHDGTLDTGAVHRWIILVATLVGFCHSPINVYQRFLPLVDKPGYDVIRFLQDLGLAFLATAYTGHTYTHSRDRVLSLLESNDPGLDSDSSSGGGSAM